MQCRNCGRFISLKVKGTVEFDVSAKFRERRPDISAHVYLCPKCGGDRVLLGRYVNMPWYAGHRIIK